MTTTIVNVVNTTVHASFGMPAADRSRCSWQRGPVTQGVVLGVDGEGSVRTDAGYRSVLTGADRTDAVIEGAFPGAPAWSPPI